jgi:hypothetical protein
VFFQIVHISLLLVLVLLVLVLLVLCCGVVGTLSLSLLYET